MKKAGKFFNIGEHPVKREDGTGEEIALCCAVDSKGIVGTDGRR